MVTDLRLVLTTKQKRKSMNRFNGLPVIGVIDWNGF